MIQLHRRTILSSETCTNHVQYMTARAHENTAIDSLYRISSIVSNTEDPKEALERILQEIVNVLEPSSASIALINPDSKKLELEASYGLSEDWADLDLSLGQGITGWSALHGQALIVPDVRKEPRYISVRPHVRSEMAVPMEDRGTVIGVVNVDSEKIDAFDDQALKILSLLTKEASRVVAQLWLFQQVRTKANQLESLVNLGRRISGELDPDTILQFLAKEGRTLMDCHSCALFILSPDQEQLTLHTMVGLRGPIEADEAIQLNSSAVGVAIHRQKQVEVTDLAFTEENDFMHIVQREGLVSMLSSPIIFNNEVIGFSTPIHGTSIVSTTTRKKSLPPFPASAPSPSRTHVCMDVSSLPKSPCAGTKNSPHSACWPPKSPTKFATR